MKIFIVLAFLVTLAFSVQVGYGEQEYHHASGLAGENGSEEGSLLEQHGHEHYVDYHAHPKYHYDYAVHDLKHHDSKYQWETRDGDKVKGEYSLLQPDGIRRTVSYKADKHNGFSADVKTERHVHHHGGVDEGHSEEHVHYQGGVEAGHSEEHVHHHSGVDAGHSEEHVHHYGGVDAGHSEEHVHHYSGVEAGHLEEHVHHHGGVDEGHSAGHKTKIDVDYHGHPKYHYDYTVHDLKNHDSKYLWETRDGDKVKGEYSLLQPDGTRRTVSYRADKHNGFNAIVKNEGHAYDLHH